MFIIGALSFGIFNSIADFGMKANINRQSLIKLVMNYVDSLKIFSVKYDSSTTVSQRIIND